jgi:ribA/ribD-fused uncharacterized protein
MEWLVNWFSNRYPFDKPLAKSGLLYETVEHYYAAHKTTNGDIRAKIAAMRYPLQAKKYAQKIKIRSDWDEIKNSIMFEALSWKFAPETSWYKKLILTNYDIVEWNNWHDNYWGICVCGKCTGGLNQLGRMIMKFRPLGRR